MLALQNMACREADTPLSNVTNGSTALVRTPQTFDGISNQILSLTSIATSLQREMAQLSRRSKDNATDLLSLKEATNARDEDIRKSLRELVVNLSESASRTSSNLYGSGGFYLDNTSHNPSGSRSVKPFHLPRIPSPNSFAASLDRDSLSSSSVYNHDSAASIALLEKILREMGTKEGQDLLVSRLTEVADRLAQDGMTTARTLEDLAQFIKSNTTSQELVTHSGGGPSNGRPRNFSFDESPRLELDFDKPRSGPMTQRVEALLGQSVNKENIGAPRNRGSDFLSEDILNIIRTVKDSVAQGGGLTAEVKALVRELRGEVLGMGREIGRKLEQFSSNNATKNVDEEKEYMARIMQDGLEELKQYMDRVLRENRRQSLSSEISRSTVDYQEIFNAIRAAVNEKANSEIPAVGKEDIVEAVREAWENYRPDIELQHFGLEREELLACLKEGIQEYAPQDGARSVGATREEVFKAVVEGFKHFSPLQVDAGSSLSREDICDAVRDCLEEFEFPSAPQPEPRENGITRDDIVCAVRECISDFDFAAHTTALSRDDCGGLTRNDLFDANKAGLQDAPATTDASGWQILERLQEIIDCMRTEFQAVSDEAKQNVAAHGRDTEQVLDATKDGLDRLRSDIESYVNRAADTAGKDEILESMREISNTFRAELEILVSKGSNASLELVQIELENLRETMATSIVRGGVSADKDEILEVLREGLDSLRADIERPRGSNESILSGTGEILDALSDGLSGLRAEVEKIANKPVEPVDMTVNYEILDTLKAGLESVRADIDRLREYGIGGCSIAPITDGAVITAESLKRNDIENLEVLITQLRIKVEALESIPSTTAQPDTGLPSKDDMAKVEQMIRNVQEMVTVIASREGSNDTDAATKEDVVAIETLLRNTKAKIDDVDPEQTVKKDHLDSVEAMVIEIQSSVSGLAACLDNVSKREDVNIIESLAREVVTGLEEMKERTAREFEDLEKVTKTDVEAVEAVCHDVKSAIEQMVLCDLASLASKDDVKNLKEMMKEFKDRIEAHADTNSKVFEERQAETVGVSERVSEVKIFLEQFRNAMKEKLDESTTTVEAVGKLLEGLGETINNNISTTDDIKQLSELVKAEFEISNAGVVGVKLDSDEKFQQTWDKFDSKMDEKFIELMAKYDDAQIYAEAKAKLGEEKSAETEATLLGTKAVAEDLKVIIDGLSKTLTESIETMDEASKTVFNRVDETFIRVEEIHANAKAEHQLTREQVFKTIGAIKDMQNHITENHPKILESIKDVLLIVGQHYDHSKTATTAIQEKIEGIPPPAPIPETALLRDTHVAGKYDDSQVHEKLDELVNHMHKAGKSFAHLNMLDEIHQQVMQTAAEVTEFVYAQRQRIENDHEEREKAVKAATIALQKRLAQKESVEATVVGLREEEDRLKDSVSTLKAEQEDLAHQKMRLCADVSSLETALRIRREELHAMEARADGLERRILEGVIDHSRALLISKANKGRDVMSRKRVPSHLTSNAGSSVTSRASSNTQSAVSMAMSGNRAIFNVPINNSAGKSRRILSLNQITHNVPTGGFKRSHSVKTPGSSGTLRKYSWEGSLNTKYSDLNKENLVLKESEEDGTESADSDLIENEVKRMSSRGTTILTGTEVSKSIDEGNEWAQSGSEDSGGLPEAHGPLVLYEEDGEVA
jgi:DNA repair exonuclease SbcCD ATPase subunit